MYLATSHAPILKTRRILMDVFRPATTGRRFWGIRLGGLCAADRYGIQSHQHEVLSGQVARRPSKAAGREFEMLMAFAQGENSRTYDIRPIAVFTGRAVTAVGAPFDSQSVRPLLWLRPSAAGNPGYGGPEAFQRDVQGLWRMRLLWDTSVSAWDVLDGGKDRPLLSGHASRDGRTSGSVRRRVVPGIKEDRPEGVLICTFREGIKKTPGGPGTRD